jgi:hypothetical protein
LKPIPYAPNLDLGVKCPGTHEWHDQTQGIRDHHSLWAYIDIHINIHVVIKNGYVWIIMDTPMVILNR